jgi:hypothetical protein
LKVILKAAHLANQASLVIQYAVIAQEIDHLAMVMEKLCLLASIAHGIKHTLREQRAVRSVPWELTRINYLKKLVYRCLLAIRLQVLFLWMMSDLLVALSATAQVPWAPVPVLSVLPILRTRLIDNGGLLIFVLVTALNWEVAIQNVL